MIVITICFVFFYIFNFSYLKNRGPEPDTCDPSQPSNGTPLVHTVLKHSDCDQTQCTVFTNCAQVQHCPQRNNILLFMIN